METTTRINIPFDDNMDRSAKMVYASPVNTPYCEHDIPEARSGGYQLHQYIATDVWGEPTVGESDGFFTGATQTPPCSRRPSYDFSPDHESAWLPSTYFSEPTSPELSTMSPDPHFGSEGLPSHVWAGANIPNFCVGGYFVPFMDGGAAPLAESPVASHESDAEPASTPTTTTTTMGSSLGRTSSAPEITPDSGSQYKRIVADSTTGPAQTLLDPVSLVASNNDSSPGSGHNIQLRTACRKPKRTGQQSRSTKTPGNRASVGEASDDSLNAEERRARYNHNLVEKQYRNRLNA